MLCSDNATDAECAHRATGVAHFSAVETSTAPAAFGADANDTSDAANWTELFTTVSAAPATGTGGGAGGFGAEVMIPLYSVIFILSIVGNILVIVTLTQNRRMRTVTNVFLLNLEVTI